MKIVRFRRPWKSVHVQFLAEMFDPNKWWERAKSRHFWKSIWEQRVRLWPKHQQISPAKHVHQRFLYRYNSGQKMIDLEWCFELLESSKLWNRRSFPINWSSVPSKSKSYKLLSAISFMIYLFIFSIFAEWSRRPNPPVDPGAFSSIGSLPAEQEALPGWLMWHQRCRFERRRNCNIS